MGHSATIHITHPDRSLSADDAFVRAVNELLDTNLAARSSYEYVHEGEGFDLLAATSSDLELETPNAGDVTLIVYQRSDEERLRTAARIARKLQSAGYRIRAEDGLLGDIDL